LASIRRSSVLQLAGRMVPQEGPASGCAALCLDIAESLQKLGVVDLDDTERELLEFSALLHNCGISIAHSAHHKHSHYIIKNSEMLLGFTEREINVIAAIARYHRKAMPSKKHEAYECLNKADRKLVKLLAGMLRIAIGLGRGEAGRVHHVEADKQGQEILFYIRPKNKDEIDLSLELHGAQLRKELLELALKRSIEFRIPE
ncbi:MAG: HD domain-containing protein, partial [Leptospiraceae bacterium]|nr:HD domain-containing protein [Leptospiraceae bacterium]